jgi:hypothetical protein
MDRVDVLAAGLDVLIVRERTAQCVDAAADPGSGLEDGYAEARAIELMRGHEPGETRSDDHDARARAPAAAACREREPRRGRAGDEAPARYASSGRWLRRTARQEPRR